MDIAKPCDVVRTLEITFKAKKFVESLLAM